RTYSSDKNQVAMLAPSMEQEESGTDKPFGYSLSSCVSKTLLNDLQGRDDLCPLLFRSGGSAENAETLDNLFDLLFAVDSDRGTDGIADVFFGYLRRFGLPFLRVRLLRFCILFLCFDLSCHSQILFTV